MSSSEDRFTKLHLMCILSNDAYLHTLDVVSISCMFAYTADGLLDFACIRIPGPHAELLHADVAIKHVHVRLGADGELHITLVIEPVRT